ncbi:MAG TPA: EamA family transporter [Acetobacteraceae bacterium]|nr:EamA family transporter [Acetobacteraceae bacterium]
MPADPGPGAVSPAVPPRRLAGGRIEGLAMLAITACSWGFNWPVSKYLLSELPPFAMRTLCCGAGAAFAFAVARARGETLWPPPHQWRRLALFAMLNYGAFTILTTLALYWLPASEAVIVTYTLPIWAGALAWPMLGERPTLGRVAAMVLGLGGVALLVGAGISASWTQIPGVLCGFAAAWVFALGTVIAKRAPLAMPPVAGVGWQALIGTIPVALLALTEPVRWSAITPLGWGAVAYVAILPMSLAYLTWFRALRLLPAGTAATGVLVAPVVGVFASAALLGEPLGLRQLTALAMTLCGVALAARS